MVARVVARVDTRVDISTQTNEPADGNLHA